MRRWASEKAGPVLEANSQGNALARLFALPEGDAARLSTYQNLAMAIGIEILIVLSHQFQQLTHSPALNLFAESRKGAPLQPLKSHGRPQSGTQCD